MRDVVGIAGNASETGGLIGNFSTTHHEMHRGERIPQVPLVEQAHADSPDVPRRRVHALATPARRIDDHLFKEEVNPFPTIRAGGGAGIANPVAVKVADHFSGATNNALITQRARNLRPPEHDRGSWRAQYGRTVAFRHDMSARVALEADGLLPIRAGVTP